MDTKSLPDAPLISTTIDLTERCNLACEYCFTFRNNARCQTLTEEMGRRIIKWWLAQGSPDHPHRNIGWWGGEPLLEWELMKRLTAYGEEIAKRDGWTIEFGGTTNCVLMTPDKIEWMGEHNSYFLASIDGIEPAHDMFRKFPDGRGTWKIVDRNIREVVKVFPRQKIRFSPHPQTIKYFYDSIVYFTEELGVEDIAFSPVFEAVWTEADWEYLAQEFDRVTDYAVKRRLAGHKLILKHFNDEGARARMQTVITGPPENQNPCGAATTYNGWSVDGYCYPCHRFNKHNQTTEERARSPLTIAHIDQGWIHREWREQFKYFMRNISDKCRECSIYDKSTCWGGCFATNYDLTGDIYVPDPRVCTYAKLLRETGARYGEKCKEANIPCNPTFWSGLPGDPVKSCVCYNMCYMEGSPMEIKTINYGNDTRCLCYHTGYHGPRDPQNTRPLDHKSERLRERLADIALHLYKEGKLPSDYGQKQGGN